ncbi:hypothetical protein Cgig2_007295 [Carnegiea gigantea]|uniref:Xaa-Pro aminopeptidase P n=1 Tax=Carnegiea gigantea TaxID=171969 RepID=A0A9Q1QRF5_9CARY|nr:hypothetical protein Cgig2_007295 [Carnegiea gigantea]
MADKLSALRSLMSSHSPPLDAVVVPSEDYHQSEYVSDRDKRREFISGFTGSAGRCLALITMHDARLWTDGRYFLQAEKELSDQWKLMRMGEDPPVEIWISENLPEAAAIGVDPWCISIDTAQRWERAFAKKQQKLVPTSTNLTDQIWKDRPAASVNPVVVQSLEFAGRTVAEKLQDLREKLTQEKANSIIVTALDEVAWLYNIRGSDVSYCPVVHAFAIVTKEAAFFYVDQRKVSLELVSSLSANSADHKGEAAPIAEGKDGEAEKECNLIWMDPRSCCYALYSKLKSEQVLLQQSPLALQKALKNPVEMEGLKKAHVRDGAAVVQFLVWLDKQHFKGLSFPTISSVGPNAAIIHYGPNPGTCAEMDPDSIYLFDSGAQVLKGHIALDVARFPKGTNGHALDILARIPLWKDGLDYRHGTGPHLISFRPQAQNVPLQASMTVTDEPGYYEDGNFGIRLENVLVIKEANTKFNFGDKGYLEFEHITWAPYQRKLIDLNLLTPEEVKWVNSYHSKCCELLAPYMDESEMAWLKKATEAINN